MDLFQRILSFQHGNTLLTVDSASVKCVSQVN